MIQTPINRQPIAPLKNSIGIIRDLPFGGETALRSKSSQFRSDGDAFLRGVYSRLYHFRNSKKFPSVLERGNFIKPSAIGRYDRYPMHGPDRYRAVERGLEGKLGPEQCSRPQGAERSEIETVDPDLEGPTAARLA